MISLIGEPLFQWDLGRKLTIDVEGATEVHIHHASSRHAYVLAIEDGACEIPNILLQAPYTVLVWAVYTDDDEMYVLEQATLRVLKRAKPDDYVYTQTEVKTWESLKEELIAYVNSVVTSGGGTTDYEKLTNLPTIEGVELKGDMSLTDFSADILTAADIDSFF